MTLRTLSVAIITRHKKCSRSRKSLQYSVDRDDARRFSNAARYELWPDKARDRGRLQGRSELRTVGYDDIYVKRPSLLICQRFIVISTMQRVESCEGPNPPPLGNLG